MEINVAVNRCGAKAYLVVALILVSLGLIACQDSPAPAAGQVIPEVSEKSPPPSPELPPADANQDSSLYPFRPALPDASEAFTPIDITFEVREPLADTTVALTDSEMEQFIRLVERLAPTEIDTEGMQLFYSTFGFSVANLPTSRNLLVDPPEKDRYWKLYFQNGSVRLKTEINKTGETIKARVFYNEYGAPILVAEPWGSGFTSTILEYDQKGFLRREARISSLNELRSVSIYEVKPDYRNVEKYHFEAGREGLKLHKRYRYTPEGSFSRAPETSEEKRFNKRDFLTDIKVTESRGLPPLIPIPR